MQTPASVLTTAGAGHVITGSSVSLTVTLRATPAPELVTVMVNPMGSPAETGEAFSYNGAEEKAYCEEFCAALGAPDGFADAVNSGTSAVYVALRALEPEPLSEVILPPVTGKSHP